MYQIAYQMQVNVIAMSNHSKVFLQLIVITLLGDKKYLTKHSECAYHWIVKMIFCEFTFPGLHGGLHDRDQHWS